jgi:hypothetical protein
VSDHGAIYVDQKPIRARGEGRALAHDGFIHCVHVAIYAEYA